MLLCILLLFPLLKPTTCPQTSTCILLMQINLHFLDICIRNYIATVFKIYFTFGVIILGIHFMLYISEVKPHRAVYFTIGTFHCTREPFLFLHLSADEHLDYFSLMSTLNKDLCVHIFDEPVLCVAFG